MVDQLAYRSHGPKQVSKLGPARHQPFLASLLLLSEVLLPLSAPRKTVGELRYEVERLLGRSHLLLEMCSKC